MNLTLRCPGALQLSAIGFELTMASRSISHILADASTLAPSMATHYWEKPVLMPHSYLPAELLRATPPSISDADSLGNPQFVLGCLNHNGKLDPHTWMVWMQVRSFTFSMQACLMCYVRCFVKCLLASSASRLPCQSTRNTQVITLSWRLLLQG